MAAGFQVTDSGSIDRAIMAFKMIDAASVDRTIVEGRLIGPDGVDRVFYDTAGTASFSASPDHSHRFGTGNGSATSNAVVITATGGTAPYSYAWTIITYTNGTSPTVGSPASATTTFTQTNLAAGDVDTATFRCTVTDSASNSTTVDVDASFVDTSLL